MATVYLGTIDAGGDGHTLLLAALNKKLGTNYLLADFDFGTPVAITTPNPTHNTKIKFGPKLASGFYGVRTVYYNRIHASELGTIIVAYDGELFLSQLLDKINEKYGVLITVADIIDTAVATPPNGETHVQVNLVFKDACVVFYSSVMIQVGLNDPTGDTSAVLPFETHVTFAFDNKRSFTLNAQNYMSLEPTALTLSRDNTTMHQSSIAQAISGDGVAAHARVRLSATLYNAVKDQLPFVSQWIDSVDSQTRGITVSGDIYKLSFDGFTWSFVENALGVSRTDAAAVTAAYTTPVVKGAVKASDGTVYVIAKKPSEAPAIWSIDPVSRAWTKLAFIASRMQCLNAAIWPELQILDVLWSNQRLWVLVKSNTSYDIHPSKTRSTPAVEVYNTNTLSTDYFPIGETTERFSGIAFNAGGKYKLITPPDSPTSSHCDVAALVTSVKNNNVYAVVYRHQAVGEYQAYITPMTGLPSGASTTEDLSIAGFQVALATVNAISNGVTMAGHYLDVLVVNAPVPSVGFDPYFLSSGVRGVTTYNTQGLKVLTNVSVRGARTAWKQTDLALNNPQAPKFVHVLGAGLRNLVVYQPGVAAHRLMFTQQPGTVEFVAILDSSSSLTQVNSLKDVNSFATGVYVKPSVTEAATPVADLLPIIDNEASLVPIGFSFCVKDANNVRKWYTAQNTGDTLAQRNLSTSYGFMGSIPAVMFAEGTKLLFWSDKSKGLFISANGGSSWQEFNAAPAFYSQEAAGSSVLNVLGSARLALKAENFKEAVFASNKVVVDTVLNDEVLTYDLVANAINAPRTLVDNALFVVEPTTPNTYVASGQLSGFGLNAFGQYSPRKVLAWDSDATGAIEPIGQYSTTRSTPYNTGVGLNEYMFQIPGNLKDYSRDVKYLGVRHWILVENNGQWKLHFTDAVQPTKTIDLFGVADSPYITFLPEVNFHLWDYVDDVAGYVPYIFYAAGRVLLLERIDNANAFAVTHHVLTISGDNGNPLTPVKMYTANRRDYWFHQKGNGLFKLTYSYNVSTSVSTIALEKVFDMRVAPLSTIDVLNGCIAGIAARNAPMEGLIPDRLPNGALIGTYCVAPDRIHRFADGNGGFYETVEANVIECGFSGTTSAGSPSGATGGGV